MTLQDPVVTRIKRDQKIPIIGFVANTGGLLGLCMGFSLVSAFEIFYHLTIGIFRYSKTQNSNTCFNLLARILDIAFIQIGSENSGNVGNDRQNFRAKTLRAGLFPLKFSINSDGRKWNFALLFIV